MKDFVILSADSLDIIMRDAIMLLQQDAEYIDEKMQWQGHVGSSFYWYSGMTKYTGRYSAHARSSDARITAMLCKYIRQAMIRNMIQLPRMRYDELMDVVCRCMKQVKKKRRK